MASSEIAAIIYGLISAASWGSGDFTGGFATKSSSVLGVLFIGYIVSVSLLSICALWLGSSLPNLNSLASGAMAGVTGLIGLAALYRGLAVGQMGIVAPLAAITTASLPVIFGIFLEGLPSTIQILGFLVAFTAIWLLSVAEKSQKVQFRQLKFPITAGIFLGLSLIFIDQAAEQSVLWSLVMTRLTGIGIMIFMLFIFGKGTLPPKHNYPVICLSGIFDTGGYTFYALAANTGRLDTAAVLASMYPGTTVILAWLVLKERLSTRQWIGVIAALTAIFLIAV